MEEIGKTKPESKRVGSIEDSRPSWNATCWVSATVDRNTPQPRPPARKRTVTMASQKIDPRIGTSNRPQASSRAPAAAMEATTR